MIGLAAVVALVPAFASAQAYYDEYGPPVRVNQAQPNASHITAGTAARDGCVNVPGEMHNSADCSRMNPSDLNTAQNTFSRDLSGRPTGATENAERNAAIARNMGASTYDRDRDFDSDGYPR
jgi:hypothetical protein